MNCLDCGKETGKRFGRYCDDHRWKHQGKPSNYKLTPEREAYLRTHYHPSVRGISHRIAGVLQVPKWRVCRWASEMGLTGPSTKGPDWSPKDDAFLEEHLGTRTVGWIAKKLKRSTTAVVVRAKRLSISRRDARSWYTARQVAEGFGVDGKTVTRWIDAGRLEAKHEGQDYPDGRPAAWRIEHDAVRTFIQFHPTAFSLAKVEPVWFLDIVFTSAADTALQGGRYAQFERFTNLQRLIANQTQVDLKQLASALSVSTRTVRRDLEALRAAGAHVPPLAATLRQSA